MPASETFAKRSRAQASRRSTFSCSSEVLLPFWMLLILPASKSSSKPRDNTPVACSVPGHPDSSRRCSRATRSKSTRSHDCARLPCSLRQLATCTSLTNKRSAGGLSAMAADGAGGGVSAGLLVSAGAPVSSRADASAAAGTGTLGTSFTPASRGQAMPIAKPTTAMIPTRPNLTPSSLEPGTSTLTVCRLSVTAARKTPPGTRSTFASHQKV
jgi:hypothetical protein